MASERPSLLFFTNPEWGQANVILATIHEFLIIDEYDIHLASYSSLQPRLTDLLSTHTTAYPRPFKIAYNEDRASPCVGVDGQRPGITFHTIPGLSATEVCYRDGIEDSLPHEPGLKGAVSSYGRIQEFFFRMTGAEYIEQERYAKDIISEIQPAVIIAEHGMSQALDACQELKRPYVVLSPNSFKDFEQSFQPGFGMLWKYPALASAFPFPIPWNLVPINIYLWIRMMTTFAGAASNKHSRLHRLNNARHSCGLSGPPPVLDAYKMASHIICPSLPELDFPMRVRATTIGCGPIAIPVRPISELDSELDSWLRQKGRKTVLVNLGTHHTMKSTSALEIANTLKHVLDSFSDIQILWKIKVKGDGLLAEIESIFGPALMITKRMRMEQWLKADPVAILATDKVVAQIHHGGANTYFECCRFGVPQIILASWWDTYEYAARVEYLGVGVFANKKAAPRAQRDEVKEGLLKVIGNSNMSMKAKELALVCQRNGEGRARARDVILDILRKEATMMTTQ